MPLPGALSKGFMAHSVWRMCRRKQNFSENIFPNRNTACRSSVVRRRETYRRAWGENVRTSFNLIIIIKNSSSKTFIFSLSWIPVAIASWWFYLKKNTTKHPLHLRIIEVKTIKEKSQRSLFDISSPVIRRYWQEWNTSFSQGYTMEKSNFFYPFERSQNMISTFVLLLPCHLQFKFTEDFLSWVFFQKRIGGLMLESHCLAIRYETTIDKSYYNWSLSITLGLDTMW